MTLANVNVIDVDFVIIDSLRVVETTTPFHNSINHNLTATLSTCFIMPHQQPSRKRRRG
jgi:hypothetical protein